jgi:glycosyltransferase involved in cell wall biosynthesis
VNILQVGTADILGGAEKVAWNLFQAYQERGFTSWMAVGQKRTDEPNIRELPCRSQDVPWASVCLALCERLGALDGHVRGLWRLRHWLRVLAGGWPAIERELGREDFNFPGSHEVLKLFPQIPDIVHCHNLHGGYFDLRILPNLSQQVPVVLTLHDAWLLSGHCAHSFACERWRVGCGQCPDLTIYPAVRRDATAYNWQRKRDIYAGSRIYVASPSRWLMDKVQQSMLSTGIVDARVIPNGVDLSVFRPYDRQYARTKLGLPPDADVLLFTANNIKRNIWKDYATMQAALTSIAHSQNGRRVLFIVLGEEGPAKQVGRAEIRFVPYQRDVNTVARYYQAADVYIHAARADTFPNTVLEALACGIPVVATAVGGIPEQVEDGITGFLTPPGDSVVMKSRIRQLLTDDGLRRRMGEAAAVTARERFDLNRQADEYLAWYQDITACRDAERSTFQAANL